MGRDLLPWSGLIMGVSSLRLEPRFGGVFSWPSSMLGGIVGNRCERLGESAERGSAQARGPRSRRAPGPRRAPPISTISTGRGRVFREPSPRRSVGASAYRVGVGAMAVVLIVEDEEQVRVLAEAIIRELGHDTLTAGTAEQAGALRRRPALHRYRPAARHRSRAAARAGCGGAQAGAARAVHHRPGRDRRYAGDVRRAVRLRAQAVYPRRPEDGAEQPSFTRLGRISSRQWNRIG